MIIRGGNLASIRNTRPLDGQNSVALASGNPRFGGYAARTELRGKLSL